MGTLTRADVNKIISGYNNLLEISGWGNHWKLVNYDGDFGIMETKSIKKEQRTKDKHGDIIYRMIDGVFNLGLIANFIIIPVRQYRKNNIEYIYVQIIKEHPNEKNKMMEYTEEHINITLNDFSDKTPNPEWLRHLNINNRSKLRKYLKNSLNTIKDYENIVAQTDIWSIVKTGDNETFLKLALDDKIYSSDLEFEFEHHTSVPTVEIQYKFLKEEAKNRNYAAFLDMLDILREGINYRSIIGKSVVIVAYMLMAQCNLPLTYFANNTAPKYINLIIENDKSALYLMQELSSCLSLLCPANERHQMVDIDKEIADKYDYAFFIDNRIVSKTKIQNKLPKKTIKANKLYLECMPIVVSKERIFDDKYCNIDITECEYGQEKLFKLSPLREAIQHDVKSFYKFFLKIFHANGNNQILFNNIEVILDKYASMRKKGYRSDVINFYSLLQFFFETYLDYLMKNISINVKESGSYIKKIIDWQKFSNEFFIDIIKKEARAVESEKIELGDDDNIETKFTNILKNVWNLYAEDSTTNSKTNHFIINHKSYAKNKKYNGFYHDTVKGKCICLTNDWLCEKLKIKNCELYKVMRGLIKDKYINFFHFNSNPKDALKNDFRLKVGKYDRFFAIISELENWTNNKITDTIH